MIERGQAAYVLDECLASTREYYGEEAADKIKTSAEVFEAPTIEGGK